MSIASSVDDDDDDSMEEWIFSLLGTSKKVQLIAKHNPTSPEEASSAYLTSLEEPPEPEPTETISLLDTADEEQPDADQRPCCWKFSSPHNGLVLKSSILLQLSYRPLWQAIPEFTAKRGYTTSALEACCTCTCTTEPEMRLQETYTSAHVVSTHKTQVTIRGLGRCQAVQVILEPHPKPDLEVPELYQEAVARHKQRMAAPTESTTWTRFTEPADDVDASKTTNNNHNHKNQIVVTFCLPLVTEKKYDPPLLWKVEVPESPGLEGLVLDTLTVLDGTVDLNEPATHVYIQGYQSWSFTGSILQGQPQPQPALPNVFSKAFNHGGSVPARPTLEIPESSSLPATTSSPSPPRFYQSDFFTCLTTGRDENLDEVGGPACLLGWLSQHQQLGVITLDESLKHVQMHATHTAAANANGTNSPKIQTDWMYAQLVAPHLYDEEPMMHYMHAVAAHHEARPLQNGPLLTGWCSWYHYYENISAANLRTNFVTLASTGMQSKVPTNVAVVDDGYMTAWGDWDSLKPGKFTDMGIVSRDIASQNMRPGVWLAPYACDKHAKLVTRHPEWIIRDDQGRPANSSNCGKFFYGLDATNPHVREYVHMCIRRAVQDWGFSVLKIDFLYAACLEGNGKYDLSMTRAQAMHLAIQTIREAAGPDVFLIGCGCPIGAGIGYVDGMRISADTGPTWYPGLPLPWWDHGTLPSLRAMLRNSLSRASMGHRWWHNDPDCLLMGESTSLTDDEVASAASIVAMTCGMMLLSDDLTKVSIARMRILTKIFPMVGASAIVLDLHTANQGMPSLLRLWCTDKYNSMEEFRQTPSFRESLKNLDHNAEATYFGRQASYSIDSPLPHPNERKRSCLHIAKGLGTWTLLSLSNWSDKPRVMHIPLAAMHAPPETGWDAPTTKDPETEESSRTCPHGYHIFSFWSSKYSWISLTQRPSEEPPTLTRGLRAHETELFHIKPVTPGMPQYVGSDLHFSCGIEVLTFRSLKNKVILSLKKDLSRVGHIFLFVPTVDTSHVKVVVNGAPGRWAIVGNTPQEGGPNCCGRILRIMVVVHANGSDQDGEISIDF